MLCSVSLRPRSGRHPADAKALAAFDAPCRRLQEDLSNVAPLVRTQVSQPSPGLAHHLVATGTCARTCMTPLRRIRACSPPSPRSRSCSYPPDTRYGHTRRLLVSHATPSLHDGTTAARSKALLAAAGTRSSGSDLLPSHPTPPRIPDVCTNLTLLMIPPFSTTASAPTKT